MDASAPFSADAIGDIPPPADVVRALRSASPVTPIGYDRDAVLIGIVHFGTGRRFRAAFVPLIDRILTAGHLNFGILAVSQSDGPIFQSLKDSDGLYHLTERNGKKTETRCMGAVKRVLHGDRDVADIAAAIADSQTMIVSVTIGDAGYGADDRSQVGRTNPKIAHDYAGEGEPQSIVGQIVAGLAARRNAGCNGLTVLACDNVIGGNLELANAIDALAVARDVDLADWIAMHIRFPAAIGDRILVDSPDGALSDEGADIAAEKYANWIIEDNLGDERRALFGIGTTIVSDIRPLTMARERQLEGGLSFLTYAGLLRGHVYLDEAMRDGALSPLLDRFLAEAADTLPAIGGFDAERYIAGLKERFSNQDLGMKLSRMARHGSRKLRDRVVPVIVDRLRRGKSAEIAASAISSWLAHSITPNVVDEFADELAQAADAAGDDWRLFVESACAIERVFGSVGKSTTFRELVTQSITMFPGFESLIDG